MLDILLLIGEIIGYIILKFIEFWVEKEGDDYKR